MERTEKELGRIEDQDSCAGNPSFSSQAESSLFAQFLSVGFFSLETWFCSCCRFGVLILWSLRGVMSVAASSWNEVRMDFGSGGAHVFRDSVLMSGGFFVWSVGS